MMKRFITSVFFVLFVTSSAFATIPNEALFNWVQYKFANMFPASLAVTMEVVDDFNVHYDVRSYAGDWGTRYLAITDDGEVIGLGDYTDGELKSFGYIDDWEDAVIADNDDVFSNLNPTVSIVYSEIPNYPLSQDQLYAFDLMPIPFPIEGMDGKNHVFFFPTLFYSNNESPGLEFTETSPDRFTLTRSDLPSLDITRAFVQMDVDNPNLKRFAIAETGAEDASTDASGWLLGDTWVVTDYGNGFEFETVNTVPTFTHGIAAYDIDGNGYDDIVAVNQGVRGGTNPYDSLHAFSQVSEGEFEQIYPFDRDHLTKQEGQYDNYLYNTGSDLFADLDNDGVKELIQGSYWSHGQPEDSWGAFRVWKIVNNELVEAFVEPRDGLFDYETHNYGAGMVYATDYNNDGLLDIVAAVDQWYGTGVEIYRNDGNLQFTRVTDEVFPNNLFNSDYLGTKELSIVDVNHDGLDDIVFHPAMWSWDVNEQVPEGNALNTTWLWNAAEGTQFPYNIGAAIYLNTGTKFVRQINNPAFTISIDREHYPKFMRYLDTKDGVVRYFGFGATNQEPIIIKIDLN